MSNLEYYANLQERRATLAAQLKSLDAEIKETVAIIETDADGGELFSDNYHAYYKHGRKSTDHESAATWANVPAEIVEKHTTTKVTVAWAKVTKEAKVNTSNFVTQAPPKFVIEPI